MKKVLRKSYGGVGLRRQPNEPMSQLTTETLTAAIEEVMNDTGCTKLQAISGLQSACAKLGDESVLEMLCEMKWELIDA